MTGRRLAAAAALLGVLASGCSVLSGGGVATGNLPGGAGGGDAYRVDVMFEDVLDLVPQAAVKVDDVNVGSVESIDLVDFTAKVRLRIDSDVELPANTVATLRQTSLLGEKFVELAPPPSGGSGRLADGAVIPIARTKRNPEVEEVFSALAALLNGGGLTELQTISVELSRVMGGRETQIRNVLRRIDTLLGALDERKEEIVRAIDALDKLTATFAAQRTTIATALDEITPALTVLADQRADLTKLLQKLATLGTVGADVIRRSREDTLADMRLLAPVLDEVVKVKSELAGSVDQLVTLTKLLQTDIPSDYLQLLVTIYIAPETTPFAKPSPGKSPAPAVPTPAPARPGTVGDLLLGGAR